VNLVLKIPKAKGFDRTPRPLFAAATVAQSDWPRLVECQSRRFGKCDQLHILPTSFFGRLNGQEPHHDLRPEGRRYVVEFRTAEGDVLAIPVPRTEAHVIRHFQERMPYGLFVPDVIAGK
jgi:hypothetical protein